MKETLTERMRHAAAHVELYDQEWEAQQLRDGADEIERLRRGLQAAQAVFISRGDQGYAAACDTFLTPSQE